MSKSKQSIIVNPLKPVINKLPHGIRNRYLLVMLLFMLWMIIFDRANVWQQYKLQRTVRKLERDKVYYRNKLVEVQKEKADMEDNKEKFAREHYFMKAADEDVFVIDKSGKGVNEWLGDLDDISSSSWELGD